MKINGKILTGVFQRRPNRFLALVRIGDVAVSCFVPNPGRLLELLVPGVKVLLKEVLKEDRKTSYDLIGVWEDSKKFP